MPGNQIIKRLNPKVLLGGGISIQLGLTSLHGGLGEGAKEGGQGQDRG